MFLGVGNRSKMKMARRCLQTFKNKGFQANCEAIRNALLNLSKLRKSIKYSCSSLFFSVGSMDFVPTAFGWLLMPFGEVSCEKVYDPVGGCSFWVCPNHPFASLNKKGTLSATYSIHTVDTTNTKVRMACFLPWPLLLLSHTALAAASSETVTASPPAQTPCDRRAAWSQDGAVVLGDSLPLLRSEHHWERVLGTSTLLRSERIVPALP